MTKKKVLFVINSFGLGGAEKSLVSLLSLFDYDNYDVDVLTFRNGGIFDNLVDANVNRLPLPEFIRFCNKSFNKQLFSGRIDYLVTRLKLHLALKKNSYKDNKQHDAQVYWQVCNKVFPLIQKQYDFAVGWGQGLPVKYVANKVKAKKKAAWINTNYIEAGHKREDDLEYFKKVNYIVSVSEHQNELMKEVFPEYLDKMKVIYDINNAEFINKMAVMDTGYEDDFDGIKIVTVGRLNFSKGYDLAIKACSILKHRGYKIRWYAVGEGPERAKLEELIKSNSLKKEFILLGAKSNPYPFVKQADIYVQTSRFEGYCLTLAEARILNKPCVTTEFDCVYNQIVQEKNGLVVKMDEVSIANGIERMINDFDLRSSIKECLKNEKKGNKEEIKKIYELI